MKKNKFRLIIIIPAILLAVGVLFACGKGFLEQTNRFEGTGDATFNKQEDVVALVNSIYDTYQNSDLLKKIHLVLCQFPDARLV